MSLKLRDIVGDIFHKNDIEKEEDDKQVESLQKAVRNVFGMEDNSQVKSPNPFLNSDGSLFNPFLDYQKLLDSSYISDTTKKYISQATGFGPFATLNRYGSQNTNSVSSADGNNADNTKYDFSDAVKSSTSIVNNILGSSRSNTANNVSGNSSNNTYSGNVSANDTSNSKPNSLVEAARKYIGTPYVYGGSSASHGGMDCSGFVYNALKDAGYNIGRTTAQGYRDFGTVVGKSEMQPGDLVFYGKNGVASHIGIYIGNGQMIHSSGGTGNTKSNPGKGVSITNVDYRSDFIEARRY